MWMMLYFHVDQKLRDFTAVLLMLIMVLLRVFDTVDYGVVASTLSDVDVDDVRPSWILLLYSIYCSPR
jgi:hypothetical protein